MKRVCVFLTVCGGALVLAACGGRSNGTMVADTAVTDTASSIPVVETYTVVDATEERMISTFGSLSFIRSN
ncbi:MAG: hypothetical protein MI724_07120, partial [Spirochaetales bacterium]|nr:hypothetical protein [Spirochaetales bacterium]